MNSAQIDIVVIGATGFTGRVITRYLFAHPQFKQGLFSFAIAARSQSKLHTLVQQLSLPPTISTIQVDVTDSTNLEKVVRGAKVIINAVGPYWLWGSPVVRACARNGVHYVDLTGETVWIRDIIEKYDYLATKTGAIIVPSCGLDSLPSDFSAFLGNKTLKTYGQYDVGLSTTAIDVRGGVSGGTLNTGITIVEQVPDEKLRESRAEFSLSPAVGGKRPRIQLFYELAVPGERPTIGSFYFMQPSNRAVVQRSFGLLELQALEENNRPNNFASTAKMERYGPTFAYDEFLVTRSKLVGCFVTLLTIVITTIIVYVAPVRWIMKRLLPQPGSGPSDDALKRGFFIAKNLTVSTSTPPVHVKTVIKGTGDPGYLLSPVMVCESALSLLLPPPSKTASSLAGFASTSLPAELPAFARKGGVLTPATAFGNVLVTRLEETGRFEFQSQIVDASRPTEGRKNV